MTPSVGAWTTAGEPWPSSHLIVFVGRRGVFETRCGNWYKTPDGEELTFHPEPPAAGKTCETCLRYSRRDS